MVFNLSNKKCRVIVAYMVPLLVLPSSLSLVSLVRRVPREFNPWPLALLTIFLAVAYSYDINISFIKQLFLGFLLGLFYGLTSVTGFVIDFLIFSLDKNIESVRQMFFSFTF